MNIVEVVNIQKMLKEERHKRSMTYEDLGKELGCSSSYVFRIEKGKRKKPSYEIVGKMISFFGLSNEDLKKYIDGDIVIEVDKEKALQESMVKYIRNMDTNNFNDVQELLEKVKEFQHLGQNTNSKQIG